MSSKKQYIVSLIIYEGNGIQQLKWRPTKILICFTTGVLEGLLEIQKLDRHDIEGIYPLYQSLLPFVSRSHTALGTVEEAGEPRRIVLTNLCKLSVEQKKAAIRDYLIAATAKDCSIMMAFCKQKQKVCNRLAKWTSRLL